MWSTPIRSSEKGLPGRVGANFCSRVTPKTLSHRAKRLGQGAHPRHKLPHLSSAALGVGCGDTQQRSAEQPRVARVHKQPPQEPLGARGGGKVCVWGGGNAAASQHRGTRPHVAATPRAIYQLFSNGEPGGVTSPHLLRGPIPQLQRDALLHLHLPPP